jgi:hypothetical protein
MIEIFFGVGIPSHCAIQSAEQLANAALMVDHAFRRAIFIDSPSPSNIE